MTKGYLDTFSANGHVTPSTATPTSSPHRSSVKVEQLAPTKDFSLGPGRHLGHDSVPGGLGAQAAEGALQAWPT